MLFSGKKKKNNATTATTTYNNKQQTSQTNCNCDPNSKQFTQRCARSQLPTNTNTNMTQTHTYIHTHNHSGLWLMKMSSQNICGSNKQRRRRMRALIQDPRKVSCLLNRWPSEWTLRRFATYDCAKMEVPPRGRVQQV